MSRPEISVVMPFAGDEYAARAAIDALLALDLRVGDELILADNSGLAVARGGVAVIRAVGERSPAHARNVGAAQRARRVDPVPRRRLPRAAVAARRLLRGARRGRRRRARGRGRAARRGRHARGPLRVGPRLPLAGGAHEASVPPARGGGQPARAADGVRAGRRLLRGRPRRRGHGLQLAPAAGGLEARAAPRRAGRAPLPRDARRAAKAVARIRGGSRLARAPLRRVRARARGGAGRSGVRWRARGIRAPTGPRVRVRVLVRGRAARRR